MIDSGLKKRKAEDNIVLFLAYELSVQDLSPGPNCEGQVS